MSDGAVLVGEPVMPDVSMNAVPPTAPVTGRVVKNEPCTASRKSAAFVRHVEIDVSGTALECSWVSGQSFGVLAPGEDARGRAHKPRLYSIAAPTRGEDGDGKVLSTTVKRTIDEHWETHRLFLGVASNYLCDLQEGDEVRVSGPNGKRFVLPSDPSAHDYLFFATGTGIAPFYGMARELLANGHGGRIALVMGAPYATDLLYHDELRELDARHDGFDYITAVSRHVDEDGVAPGYVGDRIETHEATLLPMLRHERTVIYVCGIAGMELGIFQSLAKRLGRESLEQYLRCDEGVLDDVDGWDRRMVNRQIKPTKRCLLEVYA